MIWLTGEPLKNTISSNICGEEFKFIELESNGEIDFVSELKEVEPSSSSDIDISEFQKNKLAMKADNIELIQKKLSEKGQNMLQLLNMTSGDGIVQGKFEINFAKTPSKEEVLTALWFSLFDENLTVFGIKSEEDLLPFSMANYQWHTELSEIIYSVCTITTSGEIDMKVYNALGGLCFAMEGLKLATKKEIMKFNKNTIEL
jgi:hypothetical protein